MDKTFANLIRDGANIHSDEHLVSSQGRVRCWSEINLTSSCLAKALVNAGYSQGARIAFLGVNSDRFVVSLVAAAKAGCVLVPMNWRLAEEELSFILADSQSELVITDQRFSDLVMRASQSVEHVRSVLVADCNSDHPASLTTWLSSYTDTASDHDPHRDGQMTDTVVQIYTSGTTGRPKGAELSHKYFASALELSLAAPETPFKWQSGDAVPIPMPTFHIGGVIWTFMAMAQGCRILYIENFEPTTVLTMIENESVCIMSGVPAMVQMLLDDPRCHATDFSSLRFFTYGASPMPPTLLRSAMDVFGCRFAQGYGMTESTILTLLGPSDHDPSNCERMNSVGRAVPGVDLRIFDPSGHEVDRGVVGEVVIRSPCLMTGYWRRESDTKNSFFGEYFRTGDAGYLDDEGYLYLKDRIKDMIISGGENVYPAEVEHVLYAYPPIVEAAVVGVPDERWGEVPKAFVVLKPGSEFSANEFLEFAASKLARYKQPKSFEVMDQLPRNATGKVLRRSLRRE